MQNPQTVITDSKSFLQKKLQDIDSQAQVINKKTANLALPHQVKAPRHLPYERERGGGKTVSSELTGSWQNKSTQVRLSGKFFEM